MIHLIDGQTNTVILTLAEKATLTDPFYLFVFTYPATGDTKTFTAADISGNTRRYNEFEFTLSATEDLTDGTVELKPGGYWEYTAYEMEVEGNLDVAQTTSIVETGKVLVTTTVTPPNEYDPTITKFYYEP